MIRQIAKTTIIATIFISSIFANSLESRCSRGDKGACETLGVMYITGDGVRVDGYKAIRYLEKACSMGRASGCNSAAFIYANAEGGVKQNYTKAMKYWYRACRLGDETGCANYQLAKDKLRALREGRI